MSSKIGISFSGVKESFANHTSSMLNEASQRLAVQSSKIVMLPVEDIIESYEEASCYDIKDLDALALDISENGIKNALHVLPIDDGQYMVVGGHRRRRAYLIACEKHGYNNGGLLPCVIENRPLRGREFETTERMILDNLQRDKSDYERMMEVVTFKRCVEQRKKLGESITSARERVKERLGVSDTMITRYEKIHSSLIPELLEDFHQGRIASTVCYDIAKMDERYQRAIDENWKREDDQQLTLPMVTALLDGAFQPKVKDEPEKPVKPKLFVPETIDEGITMLNNAVGNVTRILNADVKVNSATKKKILKRISKHMAQLQELEKELELMGFRNDDE